MNMENVKMWCFPKNNHEEIENADTGATIMPYTFIPSLIILLISPESKMWQELCEGTRESDWKEIMSNSLKEIRTSGEI